MPSILRNLARGESQIKPEIYGLAAGLHGLDLALPDLCPETQQKRTEPPLATAARLHVQHGAVLSRELRA